MDHHDEQDQEHEVYGGEIPDEGEMDAEVDMSARHEEDEYADPNSKVSQLTQFVSQLSLRLVLSFLFCFENLVFRFT